MSLKTYRSIDLIMLAFVGFITEILAYFLVGSTLIGWMTPMYIVSLLIMTIAIVRWGAIGLVLAIVQTSAVFIAGRFLLPNLIAGDEYAVYYAVYREGMFVAFTFIMFLLSYLICAVTIVYRRRIDEEGKVQNFQTLMLLNITLVLFTQTVLIYIGVSVFDISYMSPLITRGFMTVFANSLVGIFLTYLIGNFLHKQGIYSHQPTKLRYLSTRRKAENLEEDKFYNGYKYKDQEDQNTRRVSELDD